MTTTRESSTEIPDRYTFGYTTELSSNHESSLSTAKRLRQRLQRQQSGQSGNFNNYSEFKLRSSIHR